MVLKCHVSLLDGSEAEFEVAKNAKASKLLNQVCEHLSILEKDYFGLIYKGSKLQKAWLSLDKKMKKQINKRGKIELELCVKFYPTDPTKLKEEITRYQICLQIRKDLSERLACSVEKLTHLLSYWLQSEYQGKNDNPRLVKDCLKDFKNPPKEAQSPEFVDRVLALYRERRDMLSADADIQFLAIASGLRLYGLHFYQAKEAAGIQTSLGIGAKGVTEVRTGQSPVSHTWSRIKNISYKGSKFKLKLSRAPSNGDPRLKKSFLFESESQVHGMWKNAVEHHVFFRVGEKDTKPSDSTKKPKKKKSSLLRRLSSKKKAKTEEDVQEESKGITRKPPTVTRTSSLRRSASLRTTSSESSLSVEHHAGTSVPKKGEGSYQVSKEPQMDSESSSEAESTNPAEPVTMEKPLTTETGKPEVSPKLEERNQSQADIEEDQGDVRKYKDDDPIEVAIGKRRASGGSSILLLTETIPEEDEDDHHDGLASPRKRIYPVKFAPLRDSETRKDPTQGSASAQAKTDKEISRHLETDLDAEVLLSPPPLSKPDKGLFEFQLTSLDPEEDDVTARHRVSIEHSETTREYTEVWEEVTMTSKPPQIENMVKIALDVNKTSNRGLNESEGLLDESKETSSPASYSCKSSEEGVVRFNAEEGQQIERLLEDKVFEVKTDRDRDEREDLVDESKETSSSSLSSRKSSEEGEVRFSAGGEQQMETLPEGKALEVKRDRYRYESEDLPDESKETSSSAPSSRKSSEEGEVRFNAGRDQRMETLPKEKVLEVKEIPIPIFSDVNRKREDFYTIKEYVPKVRKDSSTEEEKECEEEWDHQDEMPHDKDSKTLGLDEDLPQISDGDLNEKSGNEGKIASEPHSFDLISSENLLIDYEQADADVTDEYEQNSGKEEGNIEGNYDDDFETDTSEERKEQEEVIEEINPDTFEEDFDNNGQDSSEEPNSVKLASVKHDVEEKPPIQSVPWEISYRSSTRTATIDFRMGENYKSTTFSSRNEKSERIVDGAASTTAATIGDGDDLQADDLDDDILYGGERSEQKQGEDGDRRSEGDEELEESQLTPPGESTSRGSSLSDITDNTDELLETNVLEKAWSQGAGLDEDDELFQILFRTPPRRRKHRNRSEINLRDVEKGKREAMAFRTTLEEEPVSPRRRQNLNKRPFIPSWPFDPMSLLDSRDLAELDRDALTAALEAQRELVEESNRLEDMAMLDDFDLPSPESICRRQEEKPKPSPRKRTVSPPSIQKEFIGARSRSPSASPRMVGEEFIPGVPDFVHSVVPYQLPTPVETSESGENSVRASPVPVVKDPIDPESMKFPQTIIKFSGPTVKKEELTYSPPPSIEVFPQYKRSAQDLEILGYSEAAVQDNFKSATQHVSSSGCSTPQSGAGNASQSEGTTSTNSKSSASSFPRFIHSVFPLRRSSSNDGRGRSKTRRKREKKITKQKSKKKHRSKSKDKKNSEKTVPVVEITAPTDVPAFQPFPVLPSPPHYSTIQHPRASDQATNKPLPSSSYGAGNKNTFTDSKYQYDQESLDKIILSESDDAHSDSGTPETVRRVDGSKGSGQPVSG